MSIKPQFNNQDVEVVTTTPLYDGFFKMVQYKLNINCLLAVGLVR